jgi:hypothetical protein
MSRFEHFRFLIRAGRVALALSNHEWHTNERRMFALEVAVLVLLDVILLWKGGSSDALRKAPGAMKSGPLLNRSAAPTYLRRAILPAM